MQYGDEEIAVSTTAIPASASASNKLGGYQVSTADATSGATIKVGFAKSAESAGGSVTLEAGDTGVKITGLNAGQEVNWWLLSQTTQESKLRQQLNTRSNKLLY